MLKKCLVEDCENPVWDPDRICYQCWQNRIYVAALIAIYLSTAVVANLVVWYFGQVALLFTAAILLPCDFLVRDILHHNWEKRGEVAERMALLIAVGAILTLLCNASAFWVAIASATAFTAAGTIDAIVYGLLRGASRFTRMTTSNGIGAIVDSIAFPAIAFGGLDWTLSASQASIKFFGGLIVTAIFLHYRKPRHAHVH